MARAAPWSTARLRKRRNSSPAITIINVKSRAEAVEWTRKFPNPTLDGSDCEIEVRQMFELEDFGESDTLDRFREIGMSGAEKRP